VQRFSVLGFNIINALANSFKSPDGEVFPWGLALLPDHWKEVDLSKIKDMSRLCLSAQYCILREVESQIEHIPVSWGHQCMDRYYPWLAVAEEDEVTYCLMLTII